ncbi:hypothetical protein BC826DRAFT_445309 [Russula brevipes]|nr:hypothetical protein BC826DRAFT_445309 [Russula brevipes]
MHENARSRLQRPLRGDMSHMPHAVPHRYYSRPLAALFPLPTLTSQWTSHARHVDHPPEIPGVHFPLRRVFLGDSPVAEDSGSDAIEEGLRAEIGALIACVVSLGSDKDLLVDHCGGGAERHRAPHIGRVSCEELVKNGWHPHRDLLAGQGARRSVPR